MWTALGITAGLFILIAGGTLLANELQPTEKEFKQSEVVLEEIKQEEEKSPNHHHRRHPSLSNRPKLRWRNLHLR